MTDPRPLSELIEEWLAKHAQTAPIPEYVRDVEPEAEAEPEPEPKEKP